MLSEIAQRDIDRSLVTSKSNSPAGLKTSGGSQDRQGAEPES